MKSKRKISEWPVWRRCCSPKFILAGVPLVLLALLSVPAHAQGDLLITPSRIVFEGNTNSEILNLANTGQDTARYLISFIQYRMTEDGAFEEISSPEPGQLFADEHVRYFPRNVVLAPNESQVVKIQTINSRPLTPGEYRSHLYFRSIPEQKPLGEDEAVIDSSTISVRLVPVFGITIPVILRTGDLSVKTTISDLSIGKTEDQTILRLTLNRKGNKSVYGNLSIDYISPEGKITQVGLIKGLAVYCPNTKRNVAIALTFPNGMPYGEGNLRVVYSSATNLETTALAKTEIAMNQLPLADFK